jgi:hypothetical protein
MFNPQAINPIGTHQQLVQQAANNIPSLLPRIQEMSASDAAQLINQQSLEQDPNQPITLHTMVDYGLWLKHLYQHWRLLLMQTFGKHPHPQPIEGMTWYPESTAKLLNDLALAYSGWLWHQQALSLPDSIESITLLWRDAWLSFNAELQQAHAKIGLIEVLNKTANRFHQLWLESCFNLADLQKDTPFQTTTSYKAT